MSLLLQRESPLADGLGMAGQTRVQKRLVFRQRQRPAQRRAVARQGCEIAFARKIAVEAAPALEVAPGHGDRKRQARLDDIGDQRTQAAAFGFRLAEFVEDDEIGRELKNQKLRSNLERLANWLVAHDAQTGSTGRITLPFDKRVLAARLGMAPEVLSRSMAALGPYRVTVSGPQVQIGDRDALTKLAQPSIATDDPAN